MLGYRIADAKPKSNLTSKGKIPDAGTFVFLSLSLSVCVCLIKVDNGGGG
jgi:hypothetical protein